MPTNTWPNGNRKYLAIASMTLGPLHVVYAHVRTFCALIIFVMGFRYAGFQKGGIASNNDPVREAPRST